MENLTEWDNMLMAAGWKTSEWLSKKNEMLGGT